jgi:C1A family cysteine protease
MIMMIALMGALTAHAENHTTGFVQSEAGLAFERAAPRESFSGERTALPGAYSIRGRAGPVEDQGQCGSCWDFALTSALRGTLKMKGADPGRLSFNYLLNCAADSDGCNGGDFSSADYLKDPRGAPRNGADGAYTAKSGRCETKPILARARSYHMLGDSRGGSASFQDIAHVIGALHKPVATTVYASSAWNSYKGGIVTSCSSHAVDHMVVIEGYDCETAVDSSGHCAFDANGNLPPGVGKWIVRNSWGSSWGDHGYITQKATKSNGKACNGLGATALYFDVD